MRSTKNSPPRNQAKSLHFTHHKKAINQFATQINWLVSIRDELLSKDISKQTEFHFTVSEQALADNRSTSKWQVTCSTYNLFDTCNFDKVCIDSFWMPKFNFCFKFVNRTTFFVTSWNAAPNTWCNKWISFNAIRTVWTFLNLNLVSFLKSYWILDYWKNVFHNFRCYTQLNYLTLTPSMKPTLTRWGGLSN